MITWKKKRKNTKALPKPIMARIRRCVQVYMCVQVSVCICDSFDCLRWMLVIRLGKQYCIELFNSAPWRYCYAKRVNVWVNSCVFMNYSFTSHARLEAVEQIWSKRCGNYLLNLHLYKVRGTLWDQMNSSNEYNIDHIRGVARNMRNSKDNGTRNLNRNRN